MTKKKCQRHVPPKNIQTTSKRYDLAMVSHCIKCGIPLYMKDGKGYANWRNALR